MPPPAPGNSRGLPPEARALLQQNPHLFYPKKGFRDVIERQKAERERLEAVLQAQGHSPRRAFDIASSRITTTRHAPVLCGQYADKAAPDWPVGDLVDQLFSLDYGASNALGQPGSMREHYRDMSYGTFDLQGGVFGWFGVPENTAYYTSDDNGLGVDRASGETGAFIRHTLQAADPSVDFRLYDNDGPDNVPDSGDDDGYVDLVMFVHPNEGGECGGSDIWSHSFSYSGWTQHGSPFVTNDIGANGQPLKVDDYVIMPAISCFGGRIEIGVFSHEFGHALGLPDLYDRTALDPAGFVSTGGMGLFCLMAAGSYGGDYSHPATPTQMCAWGKEQLGWLEPKQVVCDETVALYYQGDAPEVLKMWRDGDYSHNEWFLVENRQRKKWDKYLLGEGLLITHVDNNVLTQNDEACPGGNPCPAGHYLVMVIEADGQWEMQAAAAPVQGPWFGEAEDFFSAANNATWHGSTLPSSRDHAGAETGVSVINIGQSGDKMFADVSVSQTCDVEPALDVVDARVRGGCDLDPFLDPGETVSLAVQIRNGPTAAPATGVSGTLTSLSPHVSVAGSAAAFPSLDHGAFGETIVPFSIQASNAAACSTTATLRLDLAADGGYVATHTFTVRVGLDSLFVPISPFLDTVESGDENGWKHYAFINDDDWSHNTNANRTPFAIPGHSWFSAAPPTGKDVSLEPPAFVPGATSVVTFWQRYDTEDNWDGCVLELSVDGGETWIDVGDLTNVGYDDAVMVNPQSPISGRRCWNGLSAGYPLFEQVTLSMATWAGQTCRLRYRMGCDLAATGLVQPGWNIDDYEITGAQIQRERCEVTPACGGVEANAPVFAGLQSVANPNTSDCDAVDLKWSAATDASPPIQYLIYTSTSSPVPTTSPVASTTALKFRVEGLATGSTHHFLVRARDSQGNVDANSVEHSLTLACDLPNIVIKSHALTELIGCDADGRADASERLQLELTLHNASYSNARNVAVTLRPSGDIRVISGDASYGDLGAQHFEASNQPFVISILGDVACMSTTPLLMDITADGGYAVTRALDVPLESDVVFQAETFFDDMEGVEPNGFTHAAASGTDDWAYTTTDAFSPTHAWFAADDAVITDKTLVSPPLHVSTTSVLSFRQRYVLESGFDGAVLEISIDNGETWEDVGQSYNSSQSPTGPAFGSPYAPGRAFWSGSSNGFVLETVNLGQMQSALGQPLYAGQVALIRWRLGCDNTNSEPPFVGWWIDDISLTDSGSFATVCDQAPACNATDTRGVVPGVTQLAQNKPNPFNPSTHIHYEIAPAQAGSVRLVVYDVAGRVVRKLVDRQHTAGSYEVTWDGRDAQGVGLGSGVYFCELQSAGERWRRKLVMVR
jgi:M6 family metalloprotease-like protein